MGQKRHELVSAYFEFTGRALTVVLRPVDVAVLDSGGGRVRGGVIIASHFTYSYCLLSQINESLGALETFQNPGRAIG